MGKAVISASLLSIVIIIKWIIYLFFIPVLIFFFLKDHIKIMNTFSIVMPEKSEFWQNIWKNTEKQINNYIRGKVVELVIVMVANFILFKIYNLAYANLLAFIVGLSVVIPYIGIIIISIPIILIAAIQLGLSTDFFYLLGFYLTIQFLDGNLLVPILFSEAVNLHPITIIISVIVLGSLFNVYGLFFAIPIAIVIKAIIKLYLFPNIHVDDKNSS
jgi:putative permease